MPFAVELSTPKSFDNFPNVPKKSIQARNVWKIIKSFQCAEFNSKWASKVFSKITRNDLQFCRDEDGSEIIRGMKLKTNFLAKITPLRWPLSLRVHYLVWPDSGEETGGKCEDAAQSTSSESDTTVSASSSRLSTGRRLTGHGLRTTYSEKKHWRT